MSLVAPFNDTKATPRPAEGPTSRDGGCMAGIFGQEEAFEDLLLLADVPEGVEPLPSIFLCPPAAGLAFPFFNLGVNWAKFGGRSRLYSFQDPSLDESTEFFESTEALAACWLKVLRTKQPTGPYYLGGWSFGAVVALEMAQQLRKAKQAVPVVVMMDGEAPYPHFGIGPVSHMDEPDRQYWKHILTDRQGWAEGLYLEGGFGSLAYPFISSAFAEQKQKQPGRLVAGMTRQLNLVHHHLKLECAYTPKPYDGLVVNLRCEPWGVTLQDDCQWKAQAERYGVIEVPGSHITMMRDPFNQVLTSRFISLMEQLHRVTGQPPLDGNLLVVPGHRITQVSAVVSKSPGNEVNDSSWGLSLLGWGQAKQSRPHQIDVSVSYSVGAFSRAKVLQHSVRRSLDDVHVLLDHFESSGMHSKLLREKSNMSILELNSFLDSLCATPNDAAVQSFLAINRIPALQ